MFKKLLGIALAGIGIGMVVKGGKKKKETEEVAEVETKTE